MTGGSHRALRGFICVCGMLLALPAAAQAYVVTVHVHGAGAVVETTPAALMNCSVGPSGKSNSSVTNCVAGSASGPYSWGWGVTLQASVPATAYARGWRFEKWVDSSAGGGQIDCDPQGQGGDVTTTTCSFTTFSDLQTDLYFTDASGPQDTAISGGPTGVTRSTAASFTLSAPSDPDATFECKLDYPGMSGGWVKCSSFTSFSNLTVNGTYTLSVRSVDPSGNVGSTAARTWTVDTTPPAVTITGGPAEGSATNSPSATFNVAASDGTLVCTLDGVAGSCAAGARSYSNLSSTQHVFTVSATDTAGNVGTATRHWTVDTIPPITGLDPSGPPAGSATNSTSAAFAFSADDQEASFDCRLDTPGGPGTFTPCGDANDHSESYANLTADGAYTFTVRARDAVGNLGNAVSRSWTIDTVKPVVTIMGGPAGASSTTDTSATFAFASTENGTTFECKLDGGAFAACSAGASYVGLSPGQHTFMVRGTDPAGNVGDPAVRAWTVTAPSASGGSADGTGGGSAGSAGSGAPAGGGDGSSSGARPSAALPVAAGKLASKWKVARGSTAVLKLSLTGLSSSEKVTVACKAKGKACPFHSKRVAQRGGKANLSKLFARRKLPAGTVISISLSAPGARSQTIRFTLRKGKIPSRTTVAAV